MRKTLRSAAVSTALLLFLTPWLMGASGCPNTFAETANKTSDAAIFYDAQMLIDAQDYSGAITLLNKATTTGLTSHRGRILTGTAYAGRCGLDVVDLAQKFSLMGSSTVFNTLLGVYKSTATSSLAPDDCAFAEQVVLGIPSTEMTSDDYVFLAFVEFAKLGTTLAKAADTDDDGIVDPSFNACSTISDADTRQVGTGIMVAVQALQASHVSLLSAVTGSVAAVCSNIEAQTHSTMCSTTSPGSFSANEVKAIRSLLKGNEIGFATCGGATFSSLACTCP